MMFRASPRGESTAEPCTDHLANVFSRTNESTSSDTPEGEHDFVTSVEG